MVGSMSKHIFSEDRGIIDDGFQNAETVESQARGLKEDVRDNVAVGGILLTSDCPYCGLQWRGVIKWPEIANFFLGTAVPGTQATQRGISMVFGCRKCNHTSPLVVSWDDVDRYVMRGVKMRTLPQTIYDARAQVMAQRAATQKVGVPR